MFIVCIARVGRRFCGGECFVVVVVCRELRFVARFCSLLGVSVRRGHLFFSSPEPSHEDGNQPGVSCSNSIASARRGSEVFDPNGRAGPNVPRMVLRTYGTRDAGRSWYQHLRDKLASKFRVHESALEKGLYLYEFNGRLTFVTVTHVDDLFYA